MFPQLYQKVFETHLNPRQYLTLQLLVLMLQSYRDVSLSTLANKFPQLIKYESRVRNLQRFLDLPQLTAKLLWFPIIKQLLKQEWRSQRPQSTTTKTSQETPTHSSRTSVLNCRSNAAGKNEI